MNINYEKFSESEKKKLIIREYEQNHKSFQQIAKDHSTYANKVRRDAKKFQIKIRDKSEAQKNALQTGAHIHPTKGKKRNDEVKAKIGLGVLNSWESLSDVEIDNRKLKAKKQWESLSEDQKQGMLSSANKAVRESSKTGSKLEKFLLAELLRGGYRVEFHKEQLLSNTKLQMDMFIPSLGIVIEIDGPSHFLPIWGEQTLGKNIKYDNKKAGLILGKGYVLIRIKQTKDFSKTRGLLIYENLSKIIKNIENKFPEPKDRTIEIGDYNG
jgi:very-short-patch-repair endonuclease